MNTNDEEFVRLWAGAQPVVGAYISTMVPDYHTAEDVIQECAAIVLRKLPEYQRSRPFLPWVIGIARTEVMARRRRYLVERLVFDEAALESIGEAYEDLGAKEHERFDALRDCLSQVRGRSRELLKLRYAEDLKPRDIAKRIGLSPNTTTMALKRIRQSLRNCIDDKLQTPDRGNSMKDIISLSEAFIDGCLTPEEAASLRKSMIEDREIARAVARDLLFHRRIHEILYAESLTDAEFTSEEAEQDDAWRMNSVVLPAIRETPQADTDVPMAASTPAPVKRWHLAFGWKARAAAILLAIGVAALLLRRGPVDATITQVVGAAWEHASPMATSDELRAGRQLSLSNGFCALRFADGTKVVLEGPARVTIESGNKIFLAEGTLAATMISGSSGFVVKTPVSTITDLGTQFGVIVDPADGGTRVDVFEGSVRVAATASQTAGSADVSAGNMAAVDRVSVKVTTDVAMSQRFVRDISEHPLSLDAADLVAGGDGTTHRPEGMIDLATGQAGALDYRFGETTGDLTYHRVPSLPVIDGCFVPNGPSNQITSVGGRFDFPATDNTTWGMIFGGDHASLGPNMLSLQSVFGEPDSSQTKHSLLYLHANAGITFDLAALRRLHPGSSLRQFHAAVEAVNKRSSKPVEIFFIADGKLLLHRQFMHRIPFNVDVPLGESDRFLSIVSTDALSGSIEQEVMLGDPVFKMNEAK